ncbi:MAG: NfeD family protein [Mariprofundales bacterium]
MSDLFSMIDSYAIGWAGIAVVLLFVEANAFTSVLLWFGIGAGVMSAFVLVDPDALSVYAQIVMFVAISAMMLWVSKRFLTKASWQRTSGDALSQIKDAPSCHVEKVQGAGKEGYVRFDMPFMGDFCWQYRSNRGLDVGESVEVLDISGNILKVQKTPDQEI